MIVAASTPSASGVRRWIWWWRTTLSTKYFVEAGSTRPETRLTAINRKPDQQAAARLHERPNVGKILPRVLALLLFGYRFGVAVSAHSSGAQPSLLDAGRADITTWPNPIKLLR